MVRMHFASYDSCVTVPSRCWELVQLKENVLVAVENRVSVTRSINYIALIAQKTSPYYCEHHSSKELIS
jgi:hypothetical protein